MGTVRCPPRFGLSLLEVQVTIAIMGALAAFGLPAIQSTRMTARRIQCIAHLSRLGLATEQFVEARRHYPRYHAYPLDHRGPVSRASVHVQLLPFLDQQPLYDSLDLFDPSTQAEPPTVAVATNVFALSHSVQTFRCPEDSAPDGANSYRACYGTSPGTHATWVRGRPRHAPLEREALCGVFLISRPAQVTDGLSHTLLFSERVVGDEDPERYDPWRDVAFVEGCNHYFPDDAVAGCSALRSVERHYSFLGRTWLMQGYSHTAYNHVLTPNARVPDCVDEWAAHSIGQGAITARSLHPGGVNGVLGDGSVRFFNESIDAKIWRGLASVQGEEVVDGF